METKSKINLCKYSIQYSVKQKKYLNKFYGSQ